MNVAVVAALSWYPEAFAEDPPVEFPVNECVPVESNRIPLAPDPEPPVSVVQVITVEPDPDENNAFEPLPVPAVMVVAVIVRVPEELCKTARLSETEPAVKFPIIVPDAEPVSWTTDRAFVVDLFVTLAVSVTPSASVKMPVPALETSSQVVSTLIVIVWPVLARASSPTVGTTPPVHVAPALKFPVAALVMRAMA